MKRKRLEERGTKLEDFQKITNAMYYAMDSTKLLRICNIWLSCLKETTLHGLMWNNQPIKEVLQHPLRDGQMIKEVLQHPLRDGQMVKSLTDSLVNREEGERHQRNLNENEQLRKQIAEMEDGLREPNHKLQENQKDLLTWNSTTTSKIL
ncbi:hypothetical protein RRG08_043913 [Elysia crispata]|uniref:Uncharacterized protein n=1 Tax=Elysia crispata TaxID=231223 RepID=A0AAE1AMX5_9GAST|nr:hypothetical protein RRG08_043913 [Elysia crispata]